MLIKALCDYYDVLEKNGKVLKNGYSAVPVKYKIALTENGEIDEVIDCQRIEQIPQKNGKIKEKRVPLDMIMPKRTEKPGIDANIIEHRPLYIFGLNYDNGQFTPDDKTDKAKKSHKDFVEKNLKFIEAMDSPLINAFRNFLTKWNPKEQCGNRFLLELGKNYSGSGFAFCLSGEPENMLQEEWEIREKWDDIHASRAEDKESAQTAQCAVTGEISEIARIHGKIKGIYGGLATGSVLIGFNNSSENSYGNEQSYNSNISQRAMIKYTEALNYLLKSSEHKITLDDMTILFWTMSPDDTDEDRMIAMLMGKSEKLDESQTQSMLEDLLSRGTQLKLTESELENKYGAIDDDVDFYMIGMKPNSSRVSVKFMLRRQYGEILWNIAKFQGDMQSSETVKMIPFYRIKGELISPKSSNEKVNPALLTKLFEAVMYGNRYPAALLETLVRRVKTDKYINDTRAGLIKAYLMRNEEEGLKVALDKENRGQAYLCGRLFAVLEKLQKDALGELNTTIKDKYFSSAASKPATIFPVLMRLSQAHLKKTSESTRGFYNKLMGDIIENFEGELPATLSLTEQGKFIIGYYQQEKELWKKREQ